MNWKSILTASAKNAVTAVGAAVTPMLVNPDQFNIHNWNGVQHVLEVVGMAVGIAEVRYWWPKLQAWSQSPDEPQKITSASSAPLPDGSSPKVGYKPTAGNSYANFKE